MDLSLCNTEGDLASWWGCGWSCCVCCWSLALWEFAKLEVIAMVPIMRLRKTNRTVGVNQLFIDAKIEGTKDTDCSNMTLDSDTGEEERRRNQGFCLFSWDIWFLRNQETRVVI